MRDDLPSAGVTNPRKLLHHGVPHPSQSRSPACVPLARAFRSRTLLPRDPPCLYRQCNRPESGAPQATAKRRYAPGQERPPPLRTRPIFGREIGVLAGSWPKTKEESKTIRHRTIARTGVSLPLSNTARRVTISAPNETPISLAQKTCTACIRDFHKNVELEGHPEEIEL